jgi:hypothetical protein
MVSFPLFSSVPVNRRFFAPQSAVSPRKISRETLLATFLPNVVTASRLEARPAPELVSSGIPEFDALTGGLPRGCLSEVCGQGSSGRTSLLLAILASATQRQEACALVDVTDSFDPPSAGSAGVDFARLLWVRCGASQKLFPPRRRRPTEKNNQRIETPVEQALRITDLLLQSGGFGLVIIDLADVPFKTARRIPLTSWFRFQRAVEHTPTVLFVITQAPCAQTCAALLLRMQSESLMVESLMKKPSVGSQPSLSPAEFPSHTKLLEGFDIQTEVLRSRLSRKPAGSVTAAFTTKAVRAG